VEDLGRKAREFSVEVFVDARLGDDGDYLAARDALIAEIEQPGPGTLVHPWYGTMRVSLTSARVRESTRDGGRASFSLTFVEAGELRFPLAANDTPKETEKRVASALVEAQEDYADTYDVLSLPQRLLDEIETELYRTLAEVENLVGDVVSTIAADIRAPANMAAGIIGSIQRLGELVTEPLRAFELYRRLFGAGSSSPAVPTTTATRRRQAIATAAVQRLTRQTAVIEAARQSAQASYASRADALATAATLLAAVDDEMEATDPVTGQPVGDGVYQALSALRAAVATDLRTRGARLPELVTYTPGATLPALVVAHRFYGDASRDQEIVERNAIRHPGFVPGGVPLEVLGA
jgi:prophage DNA circulation protein